MKLGVVVVTYLEENQKYLDLCVESLKKQTIQLENHSSHELILISSGEYKPNHPRWNGHGTYYHSPSRLHYPEGVNLGISMLSKDCTHYLILNDDVILADNCIEEMLRVSSDHSIVNPISNCDNYVKYELWTPLCNLNREPIGAFRDRFYRIHNLPENTLSAMKSARSPYPPGILRQDFICFYCTLIPKSVWDKVGPLDAKFLTGQDDVDYSKRCLKEGIVPVVSISALCWHAGGATADLALTTEIRHSNIQYYKEKWGEMPP